MQVVVEDDTNGEALVTFNYDQLHSILFCYIQFSSVTFILAQLHAVRSSSVQLVENSVRDS